MFNREQRKTETSQRHFMPFLIASEYAKFSIYDKNAMEILPRRVRKNSKSPVKLKCNEIRKTRIQATTCTNNINISGFTFD